MLVSKKFRSGSLDISNEIYHRRNWDRRSTGANAPNFPKCPWENWIKIIKQVYDEETQTNNSSHHYSNLEDRSLEKLLNS